MTSQCQINSPHTHGRCCCNCAHLAEDRSHPDTDGGSILHQRGWVCLICDFDNSKTGRPTVSSGWSEHGCCEMHDFKSRIPELAMIQEVVANIFGRIVSGKLAWLSEPATVTFRIGDQIVRDVGVDGTLTGDVAEDGHLDYATGVFKFRLRRPAPQRTNVVAEYGTMEEITI